MSSAAVDITQSTEGAISSSMVAALESAWSAIRARHGGFPDVLIVLGAGSGNGTSLTLGQFAAMRWRTPEPGAADIEEESEGDDGTTAATQRWAEVFIGGEGLARGGQRLGDPAARGRACAAHVRGIKDTSWQGRWCNARFKDLGEEVGIAVEKDPGWAGHRPRCQWSHAQATRR